MNKLLPYDDRHRDEGDLYATCPCCGYVFRDAGAAIEVWQSPAAGYDDATWCSDCAGDRAIVSRCECGQRLTGHPPEVDGELVCAKCHEKEATP